MPGRFMDGRPLRAVYSDESACILSRCGEMQTLAQLAALDFATAAIVRRALLGTCARLLAVTGQPIYPPAIGI